MSTALSNVEGKFFIPGPQEFEEGLKASRNSPRKRMVLPIHRTQDAWVQRLINFLQPGTYLRPHLHPREHAVESIVLYQGAIRFIVFDEEGGIKHCQTLQAGGPNPMVDIEPKVWHGFLVLEKDTILVETKRGPYDPQLDKTFAEWAPEEGSAGVAEFMSRMEKQTSHA